MAILARVIAVSYSCWLSYRSWLAGWMASDRWMVMGRGIKLYTDMQTTMALGAKQPEELDNCCQVNCHRCGLLTIIGIQVIYPAYYDNNNGFGLPLD